MNNKWLYNRDIKEILVNIGSKKIPHQNDTKFMKLTRSVWIFDKLCSKFKKKIIDHLKDKKSGLPKLDTGL